MKHSHRASNSRAVVFELSAPRIGQARFFAVPRLNHATNDATGEALHSIMSARSEHDGAVARLQRHARTREDHEAVDRFDRDGRAKLREKITEARKLVTADRDAIEAERRALLCVPPTKTDREESRDKEARDSFNAMPEAQRNRSRTEMQQGKHGETLLALARTPGVANPDAEFTRGLWETRMARLHAAELEAFADRDEGCNEIAVGLDSVADTVA